MNIPVAFGRFSLIGGVIGIARLRNHFGIFNPAVIGAGANLRNRSVLGVENQEVRAALADFCADAFDERIDPMNVRFGHKMTRQAIGGFFQCREQCEINLEQPGHVLRELGDQKQVIGSIKSLGTRAECSGDSLRWRRSFEAEGAP